MRRNPRRAASPMRCSLRGAGRTSPESPTSAAQQTPGAIGRSKNDDTTAATTARSSPGSATRNPPAKFREDILLEHLHSETFFEYGQEHVHAAGVVIPWRSAGCAVALETSACTSIRAGRTPSAAAPTGDAAQGFVVVGEQDFRGVAHLAQAAFEHLEDADFVRGAETVLDAAQQAVGVSCCRPRTGAPRPRCVRGSSDRRSCRPW